jgi:hypothetical protein
MLAALIVIAVLVGAIQIWRLSTMSEKLKAAVEALITEVSDSTTKLESIRTFIVGVPALVGAAVADALANEDVEDDAAADAVTAATEAVSVKVDEALAAIDANTPPVEPQPEQPVPGEGEEPTA